MILESILGMELKKPIHLFLTGIVFSTIAVFLSQSLFPHSPSMVMIMFLTIPCIYVFTNILKKKSVSESKIKSLKELFDVNSDIVEMYVILFLGMVFGLSFWFSVLPQDVVNGVFAEQLYSLRAINPTLGAFTTNSALSIVSLNNMKLVVLCTIMSFLFGAGSLFILSWNASVIAAAIGIVIRKIQLGGISLPMSMLKGFPIAASYYMLHLIPEISAYFIAAVAGAMISSAMMRYKPFSETSKKIILISLGLIVISLALIFIGALIEVNVSYFIQKSIFLKTRNTK